MPKNEMPLREIADLYQATRNVEAGDAANDAAKVRYYGPQVQAEIVRWREKIGAAKAQFDRTTEKLRDTISVDDMSGTAKMVSTDPIRVAYLAYRQAFDKAWNACRVAFDVERAREKDPTIDPCPAYAAVEPLARETYAAFKVYCRRGRGYFAPLADYLSRLGTIVGKIIAALAVWIVVSLPAMHLSIPAAIIIGAIIIGLFISERNK
jgi:hypothetical protein